jgi:hypothetical protein
MGKIKNVCLCNIHGKPHSQYGAGDIEFDMNDHLRDYSGEKREERLFLNITLKFDQVGPKHKPIISLLNNKYISYLLFN